ncbi:hypothetical protein Q427_06890 [Halomonas sp. BC04]|nr:hypothetical protein Q427_06890 [Halomonas sp. BC04]
MYWIGRDDAESFQRAFFQASYLCKFETKRYGQGMRTFATSSN